MRQNIRVEMTDRGLHEAMGLRQFCPGQEVEVYNLGGWLMALAVSVGLWAGLCWFILG